MEGERQGEGGRGERQREKQGDREMETDGGRRRGAGVRVG